MRAHAILIAAAIATAAGPAAAQQPRRVALAPVSTLGSEARSKQTRQIEDAMAAGLGAVPGYTAIGGRELRRAIRKAKRSELKSCDGDPRCLGELAKLVDAELVVFGELGGLGDAQVLALKLVDAASEREVRATTAQFGGNATEAGAEARAAAYRLLEPGLYVGTLELAVDIEGATIFLDGDKVATSPAGPIPAEVGNHALRVTHDEYRDFVRFVDVRFDQVTEIEVGMSAFPIVEDEMRQHQKGAIGPIDTGPRRREPTPWYRRWYTVAGAGALVFVGTAVIVGLATDGIEADREEVVGD